MGYELFESTYSLKGTFAEFIGDHPEYMSVVFH